MYNETCLYIMYNETCIMIITLLKLLTKLNKYVKSTF